MKPLTWALILLALAFAVTGYIDLQEEERLSLKGYVRDHQ